VIQTFADSYSPLALFNLKDSGHDAAVMASKDFIGALVTTDWIITEVADALSSPSNRRGCVEFINDLRRSPRVVVVPASQSLFESAWKLFSERPDKNWSLTDCTSFSVMHVHGITNVLTGDHHFEQAGFRALLK
jgi:predicted nucleic acid-binding protein